jgi:hypothetical protein
MLNLDDAIRSRHSTRMFLPKNRCRGSLLVDEALALAQCAPSNSNIQPWDIYLVSGARMSPSCRVRQPPGTTFLPSTIMDIPFGARRATCRAARSSVMLIFSPRNIASNLGAQPRLLGELDKQPERLVINPGRCRQLPPSRARWIIREQVS